MTTAATRSSGIGPSLLGPAGLPGSAELRKRLHAVESLGEVEGIFEDYLRVRERYLSADVVEEPLEIAEV